MIAVLGLKVSGFDSSGMNGVENKIIYRYWKCNCTVHF
jgi:hypothetical protein